MASTAPSGAERRPGQPYAIFQGMMLHCTIDAATQH
jgi:hypothetical protein